MQQSKSCQHHLTSCAMGGGGGEVMLQGMCVFKIIFLLVQLRQEKVQLEQTLEQEQEQQVSKLMKKIERLEKETTTKQTGLEQVGYACICVKNGVRRRVTLYLCCSSLYNVCVCVRAAAERED